MSFFQQAILTQGRRRKSGAATDTSPFATMSGVLAYWRADLGATTVGGKLVSLLDQSGNGFHLTTSAGPTYVLSSSHFNNKPAFSFNGTTEFMSSSYIPQKAGLATDQSGMTFVIFMRSPSAQSTKEIATWGGDDNNLSIIRHGWVGRSEDDQFEYLPAASGSSADKGMIPPFNATASYCIIARYTKQTNGPVEIYQNGIYGTNAVGGGATTLSNKFNEGRVYLGRALNPAGQFTSCSFAEVAVINNPITSASLQTILQYGNTRYGILSGTA